MSFHFNAGQFEKPFLPKHLGNWEVPHWYPKKPKPTTIRGSTIPIAEPRGRLLPRVHRAAPAWGYRRTAWDYPSRITRQLADELSKDPPKDRYPEWKSGPKEDKINKLPPDDISTVEKFKEADVNDDPVDPDLNTDHIQEQIEALDLKDIDNLQDITFENIEDSTEEMNKFSSKSKTDILKHKCRSLPIVDPFSGFHYARKMHMDNLLHHPLPDTMGSKDTHAQHIPGRDLIVKPYATEWKCSSYPNEHRPLTCGGIHKTNNSDTHRPATSGGEKENKLKFLSPMDLAICWDFRTGNPRDEPKRPKHIDGSNGSLAPAVFSMVHSPKQNTLNIPETGRSNAIFSQNILPADFEDDRILPSFEKDMSKDKRKDACDVPKCSQHSCYEKKKHNNNNNKIKSPSEKSTKKNEQKNNKTECDGIHGCGTIESPSSKSSTMRNRLNHKIKNAWEDTKENHSPNPSRNKHEKYRQLERAGSLDHLNNNCINSVPSLSEQNKIYRSSPNVSKPGSHCKDEDLSSCTESCIKTRSRNNYNRDCKACNGDKTKSNKINKAEYKMAFKAGKPNSTGSSDSKTGDVSTTITTTTKNSLKIPKMRDPYSKKSYAIPTLTPPFSRWHDTSGYPEHWRLASVYQHAYKPPGPKRRPLLPAVYQ